QRRAQPRAGGHLVGARLMEVEIEAVTSCPYGESRPVRPPLHGDPFDGPIGMPLSRVAWSARVPRCPPPGFFTNAPGRYAGRAGDGCPLGAATHGFKGPQHRLMALHLETRSEEHTSELQSRENLVCR